MSTSESAIPLLDSVSVADAGARPLAPLKAAGVIASATAILLLFYAYVAVVVAGLVLAMGALVVVAIGAARFGAMRLVMMIVHRLQRTYRVTVAGVVLDKGGAELEMPLEREDAPGLFALVEETCARLGTRFPQRVVLTMDSNAFVRLRGLRAGSRGTTLGVGYDLLATMPRGHVAAVIAHEIAHARLIQRGFQGWLFRGNARVLKLSAMLQAVGGSRHQEGGSDSARLLGWLPNRLAPACNRLAAAYSRQHEFAADRLSAELYGGNAAAAALVETHVVGQRTGRVEWRDRLARVERGGSFAAWLREKLLPETAEERTRLERRVLAERAPQELSTHPALADRLRALPRTGTPDASGEPATVLLADPDGVAVRVVRHVEDIAASEGRRASEELRKRLRKNVRGKGTRGRFVGRLLFVPGVVTLGFAAYGLVAAGDATDLIGTFALIGVGLCGAGVAVTRLFGWRERLPVPMPPVERLLEALEVPAGERMHGDWTAEVEAELRAALPADVRGARRRRAHWAREAYAALEACEFHRAYVAARLSLQEKGLPPRIDLPEAQIAFGVANAYLTGKHLATLDVAVTVAGLRPSVSWAAGWALVMTGHVESAESYLLEAAATHPHAATPAALLSVVQTRLGRGREAEEAIRQAVAAEPAEPRHRSALVDLLLAAGRARSAREEIDALAGLGADNTRIAMQALHVQVLLGEDDEALAAAAALDAIVADDADRLQVAHLLAASDAPRLRDAAVERYTVLSANGFHPAAELGLAALAYERGDREGARAHLLAGMDLTRPRHAKAASVAELFAALYRGLRVLEEPERCGSWWITLPLATAREGITSVRMLVCHRDRDAAVAFATSIRAALEPVDAPATSWELRDATGGDVPTDAVQPGIWAHELQCHG